MSIKSFAVITAAIMIATTTSASDMTFEGDRVKCEFASPQSAQLFVTAKEAAVASPLSAAKLLRSIFYRYRGTSTNAGTPEADECLAVLTMQELNDMRIAYVAREYPEVSAKELEASWKKGGLGRIFMDKGEREKVIPALVAESRFLSSPAQILSWAVFRAGIRGIPRFDPTLYSFYMEMAEEGSPRYQYYLGEIYANGYGQAKDDAISKKWFTASGMEKP